MYTSSKRLANDHSRKNYQHYSITLNSWDPTLLLNFYEFVKGSTDYHLRGQTELAPTTGHLHWQLYFFARPGKSFKATVQYFLTRCGARGPQVKPLLTQAHINNVYAYVHKDESCSDPLSRIDIGCPLPKSLRDCSDPEEVEQVTFQRDIILLFGPPGTGKSYAANKISTLVNGYLGLEGVYKVPNAVLKHRWIGPYRGQNSVIIDEFSPKQFDSESLKMVLDRDVQQITTSGGGQSTEWIPRLIFLCSNAPSGLVVKWLSNDALATRITHAAAVDAIDPRHKPKRCTLSL